MNLDVVITDAAEFEFRSQYAYIAEHSESGAESWAQAFHQALDKLSRTARSCPTAPEAAHRAERIQQSTFKTRRGRLYRMLFVIRDETVYVLHIRGPRQNLMQPDEIDLPDG